MVKLMKLIPTLMEQERIDLSVLAQAICIDEERLNSYLKGTYKLTNIERLRFMKTGYPKEELINCAKMPKTNLTVMDCIVTYRVDDTAARLLLGCNKTEYGKIISGAVEILKDDAERFLKSVEDAVCADENLMELTLVKHDLYGFRTLISDIRHGKPMDCINESYIKIYREMNALSEVEELKKRIAELERENLILKNKQMSKSSKSSDGLLQAGIEEELYPDEIKTIILDCLVEYRQSHSEKVRRTDIINDVLLANDYDARKLDKIRSEIEADLLEFVDKPKNPVYKLGCIPVEYNHGKKHIKIIPADNTKYTLTFGATPSDFRVSENVFKVVRGVLL